MSLLHKLLCIGAPALLLCAGGLRLDAAAHVSIDTLGTDTDSIRTLETPRWDGAALTEGFAATWTSAVREAARSTSRKTAEDLPPSLGEDIAEKKRQNPDVVGWLQLPGTDIDTVVLQNPTENNPYRPINDYYLNRDFYGNRNPDGQFCVDYRASFGSGGREDLSHITAVYAHSRDDNPDGGLFSQLKRYRDPEFAREHPYIFFSTESEDMVWEVFAVMDTTIYHPYIQPRLPSGKFYQTLDMVHDLSYYNYDVAVSDEDKLLTLSTCTFSVMGHPSLPEINDYRFVVMARLVEPGEAVKAEATFAVNDQRLSPDASRKLRYLV